MDHLVIAPIAIPLLAGTAMVLVGEQRRGLKAALGLASVVTLLVLAVLLLLLADGALRPGGADAAAATVRVYRLGDWPALFLVVLLAARGLTGTDHVDGRERER